MTPTLQLACTVLALAISLAGLILSLKNTRRDFWDKLEENWQKKMDGLDDEWKERHHQLQEVWDDKISAYNYNQAEMQKRLGSQAEAIAVLQNQIQVFWKGVGYNASQVLHSPHTPVFDRLLERYNEQRLTAEERTELQRQLVAIFNDGAEDRLKRKAAREMLLVMRMEDELHKAMQGYWTQLHTSTPPAGSSGG